MPFERFAFLLDFKNLFRFIIIAILPYIYNPSLAVVFNRRDDNRAFVKLVWPLDSEKKRAAFFLKSR